MATTGFILPSANNDDDGTYSGVTNPNNSHADDGNYSNPSGSNDGAWFWKTFDFAGAGLDAADTVTGFNIRAKGRDPYGDGGWHLLIGHKSDADNVVDNYTLQRWPATSGDWPGAGSSTASTHDLVLTDVPTATEALSADFRLCVFYSDSGNFVVDAEIDYFALEVVYTAAGGGATPRGPLGLPLHGSLGGPI